MVCAERLDDDCAKRVQDILAQDPINFDAQFQDSVLDLVKGNTVNAIMKLEFLSDKYRDRPELMYQLALAYLVSAGHANPVQARQAVDKAAGRLSEAIKLNPHYAEAIMTYAELQIRSGNAASVIDSLVQLIKEQPQIADAIFSSDGSLSGRAQRRPSLGALAADDDGISERSASALQRRQYFACARPAGGSPQGI